MMRKTSLILLGAAAGVALTLITTQPRIIFDGARAQAAASDTYRQLGLFGDGSDCGFGPLYRIRHLSSRLVASS